MKSYRPACPPVDSQAPGRRRSLSVWVAAVLWVLAVQGALLWVFYRPTVKQPVGDERTYLEAAGHLQAGREAQLDLLWPPLYPRFLAWLVPTASESQVWIQGVQLALLFAIAWILRDLGRRIFCRRAGNLAGLLVLSYPPLVAFTHYLWPEILHLGLFVASLWILVARRHQLRWMPVLGLTLGLALLTKSLLGPFLPMLLAPLWIGQRLRQGLLRLGLVVLTLAVMVAPTMLANYRTTGELMIADSSRFNLWLGLSATSRHPFPDEQVWRQFLVYRDSAGTFPERNAILQQKIEHQVRERGLLELLGTQLGRQYFRLFDHQSYFSAQLPGGPLATAQRGYGGPPRPLTRGLASLSSVFYALVLVLSTFGIVYLSPRQHPWLWLPLAFVLYNLALFFFLHAMPRYRIQMLPMLFLYAGGAWARMRELGPRAFFAPKKRLVITSALAVTALFLAFGAEWLD